MVILSKGLWMLYIAATIFSHSSWCKGKSPSCRFFHPIVNIFSRMQAPSYAACHLWAKGPILRGYSGCIYCICLADCSFFFLSRGMMLVVSELIRLLQGADLCPISSNPQPHPRDSNPRGKTTKPRHKLWEKGKKKKDYDYQFVDNLPTSFIFLFRVRSEIWLGHKVRFDFHWSYCSTFNCRGNG